MANVKIEKKTEWAMFISVVTLVIPVLTWYITSTGEKSRQAREQHDRDIATVMQLVDYLTTDNERKRRWAIEFMRVADLPELYMPQLIAAAGDDYTVLDAMVNTRTASITEVAQQTAQSMPLPRINVTSRYRQVEPVMTYEKGTETSLAMTPIPTRAPASAAPVSPPEAHDPDYVPDFLFGIAEQLAGLIPDDLSYSVYIHVDNKSDREKAEKIRSRLETYEDYDVRGIESVKRSPGLQVRYFHEEDEQEARQLAGRVLKMLAMKVEVLNLSNTEYNDRVDAGHLELWM